MYPTSHSIGRVPIYMKGCKRNRPEWRQSEMSTFVGFYCWVNVSFGRTFNDVILGNRGSSGLRSTEGFKGLDFKRGVKPHVRRPSQVPHQGPTHTHRSLTLSSRFLRCPWYRPVHLVLFSYSCITVPKFIILSFRGFVSFYERRRVWVENVLLGWGLKQKLRS